MIKKILLTFILIVCTTLLFACGDDVVDYNTYFEEDTIILPLKTDDDLNLPKTLEIEGIIFSVSWVSDHPEVINADGVVIRGTHQMGDITVKLTANITYGAFTKTIDFTVIVEALPANTYFVTFNSSGGSRVESQVVEDGSKASEPSIPTKEHHTFNGWFTNVSLTTPWNFTTGIVTSNITLYASWTVIEPFEIIFEDALGSTFYTKEAYDGELITEPQTSPTKNGYQFVGWSRMNGVAWNFASDKVDSNLRLKPQFTPITYTITYNILEGATLSELGDTTYTIEDAPTLKTATKDLMNFLGWYTLLEGGELVESIELGSTGHVVLYAHFESAEVLPNGTLIYTADDLINFITSNVSGEVHLMNDIDMTGKTLTGSSKTFDGTFDGHGYKISNAVINASANKMGFLFKEVLNGGIIKNVVFQDSIHNGGGTSESSAFISAFAQGGSRFENITFYNVSVIHTGSYAALLFGDVINDAAETQINIRNITVINDENHWIEGSSYIGGLIGASRKVVTIDIENVYFESKVKATSQAVGAIMGRLNAAGIVLNVRQAVIKGSVESAKNVGSVLGTNISGSTLNADKIFISNITQTSGTQTVKMGAGNLPSGSVANVSNMFYHKESTVFIVGAAPIAVPDGVGLTTEEITQTWFDASGFNQTFFKYLNGTLARNLGSTGPIVETGFSIFTSQVKKYYMIGEDLDLTELDVYANYSDGSTIILEASSYQIDSTAFDKTKSGTYTIYVEYKEESKSFTVDVVSITHIKAEDLLMKQTYAVGQTLDMTNLVVKAILDDNSYIKLLVSEYTVDSSSVNLATPGTYQIGITYSTFDPVYITIHVHALDTSNPAVVNLAVDLEHTSIDGFVVSGKPTFKTMKSVLQYLINQNYPQETIKNIYLNAGTYYEKITITVPNIILIGENRETTVITYDAASGLETPSGATWGTQGSATVSVKSSATGFMAKHLTFENSFDYNHSTIADKQGVALVNEADQVIFYQVNFKGYQDTLYAKSGRQYYNDVYIEGIVDFIFGNGGPAFFENSTIKSLARSTGVIATNKGYNVSSAAQVTYGYVFYQNEFIFEEGVPAGSVDLGRPWDQMAAIAYIDNVFGTHISTRGWTEMSGNLPQNARFFEYQNKDTNQVVLPKTTNGQLLTLEQAAKYSDKSIVFGVENGQVTFSSVWAYQNAMTVLQTISFVS